MKKILILLGLFISVSSFGQLDTITKVGIGAVGGDGTGDIVRDAMIKLNHNDSTLLVNDSTLLDSVNALRTDILSIEVIHDSIAPQISDSLDGEVSRARTLTNKTIDADNNPITNIGDSEMTTGVNANKVADGTVSNTEYQYINSVSSNVQTQLDTKLTQIDSTVDVQDLRLDSNPIKLATYDSTNQELKYTSTSEINSVIFNYLLMDSLGIVGSGGDTTYYDSTSFAGFSGGGGSSFPVDTGTFTQSVRVNDSLDATKAGARVFLADGVFASPSLNFGNFGLHRQSGVLYQTFNNTAYTRWNGSFFEGNASFSFRLYGGEGASLTNPTFSPSQRNGIGIGGAPSADIGSLIAASRNLFEWDGTGTIDSLKAHAALFGDEYAVFDSVFTSKGGVWMDWMIREWKPGSLLKYSYESHKKEHLIDLKKADETEKGIWNTERHRRDEQNVLVNERQQIWLTQNRIMIYILIALFIVLISVNTIRFKK